MPAWIGLAWAFLTVLNAAYAFAQQDAAPVYAKRLNAIVDKAWKAPPATLEKATKFRIEHIELRVYLDR